MTLVVLKVTTTAQVFRITWRELCHCCGNFLVTLNRAIIAEYELDFAPNSDVYRDLATNSVCVSSIILVNVIVISHTHTHTLKVSMHF